MAAWAALRAGDEAATLTALRDTFPVLAPQHPVLAITEIAIGRARHRRNFKGQAPKSRLRSYTRKVSVHPEELPEDWRTALARMRDRLPGAIDAPAPSIVDRMEHKLCQFAWSAGMAGLPMELRLEPLRAYFDDLVSRDVRAATRRASWEELKRFARYVGDEEAVALLAPTLTILAAREDEERPLKFAKILEAGGTMAILHRARHILEGVAAMGEADKRHAARNKAAAFALSAVNPLRRDWHRIVFGQTLTWSPEEGYRITLVPSKTAGHNPEPYTATVPASFAVFIDATVLRDHDPAYLGELRGAVIERRRPLFVTYDGTPCAQSTVSRYWAEEVGTGAHIARTMIHDHAVDLALAGKLTTGEAFDPVLLGVRTGMAMCHQISPQTARKYETPQARRVAMAAAQGLVSKLADEDDFFD